MITIADIETRWTYEILVEASLANSAELIRADPSIATDEAATFVALGVMDEMGALRWLASLDLPRAC